MRDQSLSKSEFSEHVHDSLHRRRVSDGDWRHVEDLLQLQRSWPEILDGCVVGEDHQRLTSDALKRSFSIGWGENF